MWKKKLKKIIRLGTLDLILPDGSVLKLGGEPYKPHHRPLDIAVRLRGSLTPLKIAADPHRYLGEAYMEGNFVVERGTLWDFLELVGYNFETLGPDITNVFASLANKALRALQQYNSLHMSKRNVAHHYDLSVDFYQQFLDPDLQYSCAYFRAPDDTIEEAQLAKKQHIAAKLLLEPGMRVLDIGCGWGGMALFLAKTYGVEVLGITLSEEQLQVARRRAQDAGLDRLVRFELVDYRELREQFDRVVSIGMFEHVGVLHFDRYFNAVASLLKPRGVALVHSIGRMRGPSRTSGFIRKYIFPGGYIPALSEVMPPVEKSGLWLTDVEVLRLHYAETLRCWREAFLRNRHNLPAGFNDRFCRMWEFYLASSEMSFRFNGFMVFQLQLARAVDGVPLTRDYVVEQDHEFAAAAE